MGRKKKYTPGTLGKAVDAYFRKISRTVSASEMVDSGERDEKGHVVFESVPILNDDGEEIRYTEYVVPPSITDLCLFLGISKQTWATYSAEDEFLDPTTRARERVEAYLNRELVQRVKGTDGIKFDLEHNFGWREHVAVEANAGVLEKYLAAHEGEEKNEF